MKSYFNVLFLFSVIAIISCTPTKEVTQTVPEVTEPEPKVDVFTVSTETPGVISFVAANQRYRAEGAFKKWYFTKANMTDGNVESFTGSITIDMTSISEKSPKLTDHLKAPDYFNVAEFANATIDISNVKSQGGDKYTADMMLNMMGKSKKLQGTFNVTNMKPFTVSGTATVDQSFFGVGGQDGVPVGINVSFNTAVPIL